MEQDQQNSVENKQEEYQEEVAYNSDDQQEQASLKSKMDKLSQPMHQDIIADLGEMILKQEDETIPFNSTYDLAATDLNTLSDAKFVNENKINKWLYDFESKMRQLCQDCIDPVMLKQRQVQSILMENKRIYNSFMLKSNAQMSDVGRISARLEHFARLESEMRLFNSQVVENRQLMMSYQDETNDRIEQLSAKCRLISQDVDALTNVLDTKNDESKEIVNLIDRFKSQIIGDFDLRTQEFTSQLGKYEHSFTGLHNDMTKTRQIADTCREFLIKIDANFRIQEKKIGIIEEEQEAAKFTWTYGERITNLELDQRNRMLNLQAQINDLKDICETKLTYNEALRMSFNINYDALKTIVKQQKEVPYKPEVQTQLNLFDYWIAQCEHEEKDLIDELCHKLDKRTEFTTWQLKCQKYRKQMEQLHEGCKARRGSIDLIYLEQEGKPLQNQSKKPINQLHKSRNFLLECKLPRQNSFQCKLKKHTDIDDLRTVTFVDENEQLLGENTVFSKIKNLMNKQDEDRTKEKEESIFKASLGFPNRGIRRKREGFDIESSDSKLITSPRKHSMKKQRASFRVKKIDTQQIELSQQNTLKKMKTRVINGGSPKKKSKTHKQNAIKENGAETSRQNSFISSRISQDGKTPEKQRQKTSSVPSTLVHNQPTIITEQNSIKSKKSTSKQKTKKSPHKKIKTVNQQESQVNSMESMRSKVEGSSDNMVVQQQQQYQQSEQQENSLEVSHISSSQSSLDIQKINTQVTVSQFQEKANQVNQIEQKEKQKSYDIIVEDEQKQKKKKQNRKREAAETTVVQQQMNNRTQQSFTKDQFNSQHSQEEIQQPQAPSTRVPQTQTQSHQQPQSQSQPEPQPQPQPQPQLQPSLKKKQKTKKSIIQTGTTATASYSNVMVAKVQIEENQNHLQQASLSVPSTPKVVYRSQRTDSQKEQEEVKVEAHIDLDNTSQQSRSGEHGDNSDSDSSSNEEEVRSYSEQNSNKVSARSVAPRSRGKQKQNRKNKDTYNSESDSHHNESNNLLNESQMMDKLNQMLEDFMTEEEIQQALESQRDAILDEVEELVEEELQDRVTEAMGNTTQTLAIAIQHQIDDNYKKTVELIGSEIKVIKLMFEKFRMDDFQKECDVRKLQVEAIKDELKDRMLIEEKKGLSFREQMEEKYIQQQINIDKAIRQASRFKSDKDNMYEKALKQYQVCQDLLERVSESQQDQSRIISTLVQLEFMQTQMDCQDEYDKQQIHLFGIDDTKDLYSYQKKLFKQQNESNLTTDQSNNNHEIPPLVRLNMECLSCGDERTRQNMYTAYKMACIQYKPSDIAFMGSKFNRKSLIEAKRIMLEHEWIKLLNNGTYNRLFNASDPYKQFQEQFYSQLMFLTHKSSSSSQQPPDLHQYEQQILHTSTKMVNTQSQTQDLQDMSKNMMPLIDSIIQEKRQNIESKTRMLLERSNRERQENNIVLQYTNQIPNDSLSKLKNIQQKKRYMVKEVNNNNELNNIYSQTQLVSNQDLLSSIQKDSIDQQTNFVAQSPFTDRNNHHFSQHSKSTLANNKSNLDLSNTRFKSPGPNNQVLQIDALKGRIQNFIESTKPRQISGGPNNCNTKISPSPQCQGQFTKKILRTNIKKKISANNPWQQNQQQEHRYSLLQSKAQNQSSGSLSSRQLHVRSLDLRTVKDTNPEKMLTSRPFQYNNDLKSQNYCEDFIENNEKTNAANQTNGKDDKEDQESPLPKLVIKIPESPGKSLIDIIAKKRSSYESLNQSTCK